MLSIETGDEARRRAEVAVVVVNRDGGESLFAALDSCRAQAGVSLEVVVVDNGSHPQELQRIESEYPEVRLLRFPRNRGFAAGANDGIARTHSSYVLLLNNDARLESDCAARLKAQLDSDSSLAAAQALVLARGSGRVDTAGIGWNGRGQAVPVGAGRDALELPAEPFEVAGVSATAALYRREAIDSVAREARFLEESFFAYYEDVEASLRLARAGWRFVCCPKALAYHEGSRTAGRMPLRRARWTARNRWRTLARHFDPEFLRRHWASLLRADLAHARGMGLFGPILLLLVWPAAMGRLLLGRPAPGALTQWPAVPVHRP